jgi:hypothetical protein
VCEWPINQAWESRDGSATAKESQRKLRRNCRPTRVEKVPAQAGKTDAKDDLERSAIDGSLVLVEGGQGALSEPGALRGSV